MSDARPMRGDNPRAADAAWFVNNIMERIYNAHMVHPYGGNIKGAILLLGRKEHWAIQSIEVSDRMSMSSSDMFAGYPVMFVTDESYVGLVTPTPIEFKPKMQESRYDN